MLSRVWTRIATASIFVTATSALNFGAIAPNSSADLTMTVTGAVVGNGVTIGVDNAVISGGTNMGNVSFFSWVSATNTVTIRATNHDTALTANPANGNFSVMIIQL